MLSLPSLPLPARDAWHFFGGDSLTNWYRRIAIGEIQTITIPFKGRRRQLALQADEVERLLDQEEQKIEHLRREHAERRRVFELSRKAQAKDNGI
jgi:hypothetical protein